MKVYILSFENQFDILSPRLLQLLRECCNSVLLWRSRSVLWTFEISYQANLYFNVRFTYRDILGVYLAKPPPNSTLWVCVCVCVREETHQKISAHRHSHRKVLLRVVKLLKSAIKHQDKLKMQRNSHWEAGYCVSCHRRDIKRLPAFFTTELVPTVIN